VLFAILVTTTSAPAFTSQRFRRECRQLCQVYRPLCTATDGRGRQRLYRLCWQNLLMSCRLSATQTFPPAPTCTFPCGSDADCTFGRTCVAQQCIIPPVFGTGGRGKGGGGATDCACRCDNGAVCNSNGDCGVDSFGIPNVCGCPQNPPCDGHGHEV